MRKLNKYQQRAVDSRNHNVLLSAGAGSGKTEVLGTRVTDILNKKEGKLSQFLVVTFTKDAAFNMNKRIKKFIISKNMDLGLINEVDSADICTFDSFTQRLCREYSYLIGIKNDFSVIDSSDIATIEDIYLEEYINKCAKDNNKYLNKLYLDYCFNNSETIFKLVKNIINKEKNLLNNDYRNVFLNNVSDINTYDFYKQKYLEYKLKDIEYLYDRLSKQIEELISTFDEKLKSCDITPQEKELKKFILERYEEFSNLFNNIKLNNLTINEETLLNLKNAIRRNGNIVKDGSYKNFIVRSSFRCFKEISLIYKETMIDLESLLDFDNTLIDERTFNENLDSKMELIQFIYSIVDYVEEKVKEFKTKINSYEFIDFTKFCINLLQTNEEVREEIKAKYKYIMVDECQDNNDLQEITIDLISNNNLFYVGDIKQSIYRFRNSNPILFKNRYEKYKNNNFPYDDGELISMNQNYRSTSRVIDLINTIFKQVMDIDYGDIDYNDKEQQLTSPEDSIYTQNSSLFHKENKIFYYQKVKSSLKCELFELSKAIADIKERVESDEMIGDVSFVDDKPVVNKRKIRYSDFAIISKDAVNYTEYLKLFKKNGIPVINKADEEITTNNLLYSLLSIIKLINMINNEDYLSNDTKHAFYSIARSIFFELNDDEVYNLITTDKYLDHPIVTYIKEAINNPNNNTILDIFLQISYKYQIVNSLYKSYDPNKFFVVYNYFVERLTSLVKRGYSLSDTYEFLKVYIENKNTCIKLSMLSNSSDAVTLINIHKSKGLEYNFIYFLGFSKDFRVDSYNNIENYNTELIHDCKNNKDYCSCINFPMSLTKYYDSFYNDSSFNSYRQNSYISEVLKKNENQKSKSEYLRVLYVALTRAKYQIIMYIGLSKGDYEQLDLIRNNESLIDNRNFRSFSDLLKSVNFNGNALVDTIGILDENEIGEINKDYTYLSSDRKINDYKFITDFNLNYLTSSKSASKGGIVLNNRDALKFGNKVHEILQYLDFNNPDLSFINNKLLKEKIEVFLNSNLIKENKDAVFFKEYEFYNEESKSMNSIDLLIKTKKNKYIIVDYKLKHIDDEAYIFQLNTYKKYIEKVLKTRDVESCLYSIFDETIKYI